MTSTKTTQYIDKIPDYHHGLLTPDETVDFEKELEKNRELQEELTEFRNFAKLYQQVDSDIPEPSPQLFDRIMTSIEHAEESGAQETRQADREGLFSSILANIISWLKESVSLPWGLAVVQAVALVILLLPAPQTTNYKTLSSVTPLSETMQGESYNIVFKPNAREADIRELLLSCKASIVSGPSPQGRYIIVLPDDGDQRKKLEELKKQEPILFIERSN